MGKKRLLLGASYSIIEPLGLLYLAGLARDEGWDSKIILVKNHNYNEFFELVKDFKPDIVGHNVFTGNHQQTFNAFKKLKTDFPNIQTIIGGPHATYFSAESSQYADYVVMSEGFNALRKILNGQVKPGILPLAQIEKFPMPNRDTFYKDYPEHAKSKIKSIISTTGCPYTCTYCYNSSTIENILSGIPTELFDTVKKSLTIGNRVFPHNLRSVDDVISECSELVNKWPTDIIYFQDDVHGADTKQWLPELAKRWKSEVGVPYHAQTRFEMTKNSKRLDYLLEAGCFGLTLAIEAADFTVRKEVLNRSMRQEIIFEGMKALIDRGFRVRTEQITGLPYGATSIPTAINLDADIELIKLNVELREKTGGPTMAWASTLVPYARTELANYCDKHGYYDISKNNGDVHDTFFERSILRFPKKWTGPSLKYDQESSGLWLEGQELEQYRDQNAELRRLFNFFTLVPKGHVLAEKYLKKDAPFSYNRLGKETIIHLKELSHQPDARKILDAAKNIEKKILELAPNSTEQAHLNELIPYFAVLPKGDKALKRYINYGQEKGFNNTVLSTATRHHLYDEVLYSTEDLK
jgi:radical SAM superfamily enzyme YgiQ (UPF0313 family)